MPAPPLRPIVKSQIPLDLFEDSDEEEEYNRLASQSFDNVGDNSEEEKGG